MKKPLLSARGTLQDMLGRINSIKDNSSPVPKKNGNTYSLLYLIINLIILLPSNESLRFICNFITQVKHRENREMPRAFCSWTSSKFLPNAFPVAQQIRQRRSIKHSRPINGLTRIQGWKLRSTRDEDFAIFQFTLGIPGVDDDDVPRIAGLLCAFLVFFNNVASVNPTYAQTSTEQLAIILAVACITAPLLGRRLSDTTPYSMHGGESVNDEVFALSQTISDVTKADMAWATYALLTQTNAKGVLLFENNELDLLCARGQVHIATGTAETSLVMYLLTESIRNSDLAGTPPRLYLTDRRAIDMAGANNWGFLPQGTESVFMQLGNGNVRVLLFSDQPRAFSKKQRNRVAAVANKLCQIPS